MDTIIKVEHLSKSFGEVRAVDDLSFEVKKGKLFAFLGQNGAGKSTTINMLIGNLEKDNGKVVYGNDQTFLEFKDKIGVVFQNNIFDDMLTVEENMKLYGRLYSTNSESILSRYEELATLFEFKHFEKKRFRNLSGGQKRRVEIARALFNTPELLFLDEPTTGLDPKTRIDVWSILHKIRETSGMTIFLTTHYMEETNDADEVVIIHNGKKIAEGTPAELKEKYSTDRIRIVPKDDDHFAKKLKEMKFKANKVAETYEFLSKDVGKEIALLEQLKDEIKYFEVLRGSMDDVFLTAVGEKLAGGQE